MTAAEKLMDAGYDDVIIFSDYSYDDALIGVSTDGQAIYDYDKMIAWLVDTQGFTYEEAYDWVQYNTIRSLDYMENGPIIMYALEEE